MRPTNTGLSRPANPGRPNPVAEAELAAKGLHARGKPVETAPGRYAVACRCGWYEDDLPSKRAGHRAMTVHLEDNGSLAYELETSTGRGRLTARARERALIALADRYPAELAQIEEDERVKLGLHPTPRQETSA